MSKVAILVAVIAALVTGAALFGSKKLGKLSIGKRRRPERK